MNFYLNIVFLLLQINLLLKLLKNFLIVLKKSGATKVATDAFKTASKRAVQKIAEANGDLIGNKIADLVAKLHNDDKMNTTSQNTSNKSITPMQTENLSKIIKERYIPPGKGQQIIGELTLM